MIPAVTAIPSGAGPDTRVYHLFVRAAPGSTVSLRSAESPGWIASFCTDKVCSVNHSTVVVPSNGTAVLKLDVFRTDAGRPRTAHLTVFEGSTPVLRFDVTVP
jgi:hypothetical protein